MPHLVSTIRRNPNASVRSQLEQSFIALASAWHAHYNATRFPTETPEASGWRAFAKMVREAAAPVDLSAARRACPLIQKLSERPEEVFHALGHMEVLLAAIERLAQTDLNLSPDVCAPTQQSTDDTNAGAGDRLPDLGGSGFVLEAYGGVCYANNSKGALDFRTLQMATERDPTVRTFVATRREALTLPSGKDSPRLADGARAQFRCGKKHGGPWGISATVVKRCGIDDYVILELADIRQDSIRPRL